MTILNLENFFNAFFDGVRIEECTFKDAEMNDYKGYKIIYPFVICLPELRNYNFTRSLADNEDTFYTLNWPLEYRMNYLIMIYERKEKCMKIIP